MTEEIVHKFLRRLYQKRPFILDYDERVAMALVDVRYNPAGVSLYGPVLTPFWNALDPTHPGYDLSAAMQIFEQKWTGSRISTKQPRYLLRHYQRTRWMREGLLMSQGSMWSAPQANSSQP